MKSANGKTHWTACPNPWKFSYPTRREATAVLRRDKRYQKLRPAFPYQCRCGKWHLTTKDQAKRA